MASIATKKVAEGDTLMQEANKLFVITDTCFHTHFYPEQRKLSSDGSQIGKERARCTKKQEHATRMLNRGTKRKRHTQKQQLHLQT
jgi:hypothetical protein